MKYKVILATMFAATVANACPDLSGTYTCPADQADEQPAPTVMTITQMTENNVTTYTISEAGEENESIVADGVARTTKEEEIDENGQKTTYTTIETWTCEDSTLKADVLFNLDPNPYNMSAKASLVASLTADGDFQSIVRSTTLQDGKEIGEEQYAEICKRNK